MSRLELRYDAFMDEFSTLLQRHAASRSLRCPPSSAAGG